MPGNPAIRFTIWHPGGAVEASLHMQVKLHARLAAVGRVTELAPFLQGYVEVSHHGGRPRWIIDIGIGDTSRPAMIRAAVGVVIRHVATTTGTGIAIVAQGEVAEALTGMPARIFADTYEARRWLASTTSP